MNKNFTIKRIVDLINNDKVKNYLYPALFFIIFSIFIIFAIKPSLTTAFELLKEEKELSSKNENYQRAINFVSQNLSILESYRDKLFLLDESVPSSPQIYKVIEDIYKTGEESSLSINNINLVDEVEYSLKTTPKIKQIEIDVDAEGGFDNLISLIDKINNQRRIKTIKNIEISRSEKLSTESSRLKIKIKFEGYYL